MIKKYILLPSALLVYAVVMAVLGWDEYVKEGKMLQFTIICIIEAVVIIALYFALRYIDKSRTESRRRRQSADRRSLL